VSAAGLLFSALLFQAASPLPPEELQRGKNAFDRGEFARAVEIVRPLLYPEIRLQSDPQLVQARRILGVSYLFEKRQADARVEFHKLLQLVPDYRFDPLLDPPEVVDFFNNVRKQYGAELARLEAKRKELERAKQRNREECEKALAGPLVIERRVGRNSYAVNFLPFGAGQFQNGHRRKGWAFLTAESILAAASIGAFATNLAVYGLRPERRCRYDMGDAACPPEAIDRTEEKRSRWLLRAQVGSGAAFFAVVAWGILDAIYYYRPETQLSLADVPKPSGARSEWRILPLVTDRTIGTGLHFRF